MNAAHLHLILNHIPVLGGLGTLILMGIAAFKENDHINKLTLQFIVLIGILTIPVYFTGEPAEEVIEHLPGVTEAFISQHEKFALYSLVCTEILALIAAMFLFSFRKTPEKVRQYWNIMGIIALVNAGLMLATANYGGEIRHTEIRKSEAPSNSASDTSKTSNYENIEH